MSDGSQSSQGKLPADVVRFLLDRRRFGSYTVKNKTLIHFLEVKRLPFCFESMIAFVEWKQDRERRASTINIAKYQIQRIIRELIAEKPDEWTALEQWRIEKVFRRIRTRTVQNRHVGDHKRLAYEEIRKVAAAADPYVGLVIAFLAETGLRVSELVGLNVHDGDLVEGRYHVTVMGKGGKQRTVYCSTELWKSVRVLFGGRYGPLFHTENGTRYQAAFLRRRINVYGQRALSKRVHPHMLRHSLASKLIADGADLHAVSDYLGHSTEAVTADMYVHTRIAPQQVPDVAASPRGYTTRGRKERRK